MIIMTRSEFFKKIGLGALACVITPKVLANKPKKITSIDDFNKVDMVTVPKLESIKFETKEIVKNYNVPESIVHNDHHGCFMFIETKDELFILTEKPYNWEVIWEGLSENAPDWTELIRLADKKQLRLNELS